MKNKLRYLIIGFIGVLIGISITLGFGAWISATESDTLSLHRNITFGDIRIRLNKPDQTFNGENFWEVWILKNDVPFALISQNEKRETTWFNIAEDFNDRSIASMESAISSGKWKDFQYSGITFKEKRTGMSLTDFDLDGNFDFELIVDGNETYRSINVENNWLHINKYDPNTNSAVSTGTTYIFKENIGWTKK